MLEIFRWSACGILVTVDNPGDMKSHSCKMIVCLLMIAVALTPSRAQGATFVARDFSAANKVTFLSEGEKAVAFLFTPPGFDPTSKVKLPAVAFMGPMSGLKDQVTGVYARKLAALGYATISFDPRYQGESDGKPRDLESPSRKVEDLRSAIRYLRSLPYVDVARISVIGICGGGGVAAKVVETDPAIHRFVGIAAYYDDVGQKRAMIGDRFEEQVAAAKAQWAEYEKTGKIATIAMVSDDAKIGCAMRQQPGTENEPFAYYGTARGASPNYTNRFALMSLADLLTFDSMAGASRIKAPTLIVHGTIDAYCTPENARQFYDALSTRKAYREIPTTNHIELYDDENRVNQAVAFANEWLSDQP